MQKEMDWSFYVKIVISGIFLFFILVIILFGSKAFQPMDEDQVKKDAKPKKTNFRRPLRMKLIVLNTISLFFLLMSILSDDCQTQDWLALDARAKVLSDNTSGNGDLLENCYFTAYVGLDKARMLSHHCLHLRSLTSVCASAGCHLLVISCARECLWYPCATNSVST